MKDDKKLAGTYAGYDGPCPPWNDARPHRYIFTLYALKVKSLNLPKNFTGQDGKYVTLADTIKGFKGIVNGDYDHLPEQAFYMVGAIEEAVEKAKTLQ